MRRPWAVAVGHDGDVPTLRFRRRGLVVARRLESPVEWRTEAGDVLRAEVGDWWVEGPAGVTRSVTDAEFRATYEEVSPGRYRRTGTVTARRVLAPEVVDTLEGPASARPGDWVVTGPHGNSWPVPDEVFHEGYEPL